MTAAERRILPIGIQSFSKLREGHYYYVDKTPLIRSMAKIGGTTSSPAPAASARAYCWMPTSGTN